MIKQRTLYRLTSCRVCFHPRTSQPKYILSVGFSSQNSKHGGRKWHLVTKKWQLLALGQNIFQWVLTRLGFNAIFEQLTFLSLTLSGQTGPDLVPKSKLNLFANIECLLHAHELKFCYYTLQVHESWYEPEVNQSSKNSWILGEADYSWNF